MANPALGDDGELQSVCILPSADSDSTLMIYYQQQAFPSNGEVCSASEVVVYSANVSVPVSTSHEAAMTCQSLAILDYCKYDCSNSDGVGGISCSCMVEGQFLDPELLNDKGAQSCLNSALLEIPQTEFNLGVTTKQREPSLLQTIVFTNAGDKPLIWNVTTIRANGTWLVTPRSGQLIGCDFGTITVALLTWNLAARSDPYALELEFTSNSYRDPTRSIFITAFVSAEPNASSSVVTVTSRASQVAAGDTVNFVVTPIDEAGIVIFDTSNLAYLAELAHPVSHTSVSCRVVFDTSSGEQEGACEIPSLVCDLESDDCLPPVGNFVLEVKDAQGLAVGAAQYPFSVERCPAGFFYDRDGSCVSCPPHVECSAGSSISNWQLDPGFWRTDAQSDEVRECRFGRRSCPGANSSQAAGRDAYCGPAFVGPLCSQCAADHFLSWTGEGDCHKCASGKSHWPTIGLVSSVVILGAVFAGAIHKCRSRKIDAPLTETTGPPSKFARLEKLFLLAKVKIFTLFLVSQASIIRSFLVSYAFSYSRG